MTRLKIGDTAPEFTARTASGQAVSLRDHRGKAVWLSFLRFASCPFCSVRMYEMRDQQAALTSDKLQILAVFQSPGDKLNASKSAAAAWYPLLADPEQRLYGLYGVEASLKAMAKLANLPALARAATSGLLNTTAPDGPVGRIPADFLIDPSGRIADCFYGDAAAEHIPLDRVKRFLATL
jgi:peroxiredoxin Q/BCP